MKTTRPLLSLFVLMLAIGCKNPQKGEGPVLETDKGEMTAESQSIINEAVSENEALHALNEVRTIMEALDKSILVDGTTPAELAAIFPIDLEKGDEGRYRKDISYSEYKTINEFAFEEGVLNSITCSTAFLDKTKKGQNNHGEEVLAYLTAKLGKPKTIDKEQRWEREKYNIVFRDVYFYDDGNWTLWIQSHKDYFPAEFLPEE